ncbi:M15 family metallopeptidase [Isoptericola aurantiacus]|uniref:M15 family metallopeptidase n=1 Tax=Isoptericola aurantiacus TaxID=3377839 RepID=UPI00383AAA13
MPAPALRHAARLLVGGLVAAVLVTPATAAEVPPHDPHVPAPEAPSLSPTAIVGWAPAERRTAGEAWSDGVVVSPAAGRDVELQQQVDGRWVARRSLTLDDGAADVVLVDLPDRWTHAPVTRWRLSVAGSAHAAPAVSGTKRVETVWPAVSDPRDPTVLVTKERGVEPAGFRPRPLVTPDLATVGHRTSLRPRAATALAELAADAQEATGRKLVLVSGFRSARYQDRLFARYAAEHGARAANRFSARPGHSEHQTGWAADVTQAGVPFTEFGGTPSSAWVDRHAWRYGYVVRYPEGAEEITGYDAEPWHLRYVGRDLAAYLHRTGGTLEEAVGID